MPLDFQPVHIPLASGIDTKRDPRALEPPGLAVCRNAQFDEVGGIQTRKPFAALGTDILGGGSLSEVRRVVANGPELLAFTKDALYSWSESQLAWVRKDTYLAPKVDEASRFVRTSDQVACDRAELAGVVVYAWSDDSGPGITVYVAAIDKTTEAVILAPTAVSSLLGSRLPRLLALEDRILLFYGTSTPSLKVLSLDPANLATSVAGIATTVAASFHNVYDVAAAGTNAIVVWNLVAGTSYGVAKVTPTPTVSASTKVRVCDDLIAIAVAPDGVNVQIARTSDVNIKGDTIDATTLGDVDINQSIGTTYGSGSGHFNQIAAAYRSVQDSGQYRCYVTWSSYENAGAGTFYTKSNWVDTGGDVGTEAILKYHAGVASRSFDHDGYVYTWLAFAGETGITGGGAALGFRAQFQNTYFLYRDDGLLVAKAAPGRAGGFAYSSGHLPNVQALGDGVYAWCGTERRAIQLGGKHSGYGARAPREIIVEFDSDEARRCARLGETLYIAGGQILQYDGEGLTEVGFHIYPWAFSASMSAGGSKAAGDYTYKGTYRWDNAKGERDRSTTATNAKVTLSDDWFALFDVIPAHFTLKQSPRSNPAAEMWGTLVNPPPDAPFYLVTDVDPTNTSNPNRYLESVAEDEVSDTLEDDLTDEEMATKEVNPENGDVLENLAPPAASVICATQDRIFLAGVPGDPHRVWYSKLRGDGEVAAFHDALVVDIPHQGGDITALVVMDETLIAFRETAIYALPGDGFSNTEEGQNYGPARRLSGDVGAVSAEAVGVTPQGILFKSRKGWYLQGRGGGAPEYVGGPVASFDSDTVVAVHVVEAQHQIRCLTTGRMLVWDYLVNQWSEWTVADGLGATVWDGTYTYATSTGAKTEQDEYTALDYALDVETAWIKLAGLQGYQKVRWAEILGEYRSAHDLRIRIAYNFEESDASGPTWVDSNYHSPALTTVGGPLQVRVGPARPRGQSIKFRLTTYADGSTTTAPAGEACRLTGIALEVGVIAGLNRRLLAAQKT